MIGEENLTHNAPTHEWQNVLPVGIWLKEIELFAQVGELSDNAGAMFIVIAINNDMDISLNTNTGIQDILEDLEVTEGGFAYHLADEEIVFVMPIVDVLDALSRKIAKLSQGYKAGSELTISAQIFSITGTAWSAGTTGEVQLTLILNAEVA